MLNNTKETNQRELLNIQTNAEENQSKEDSSELIKREKIEGTPFTLIGSEKGYFIAMGKYKLTEETETKEETLEKLTTTNWDIIIRMITTTHEMVVNAIMEDNNKPKTINETFASPDINERQSAWAEERKKEHIENNEAYQKRMAEAEKDTWKK